MKSNEYGKYLRTLRENKKLTIRQLALYSGVSNGYLSQVETGERNPPSAKVIKKLSNALNINYQEMMIEAGHLPPEHKNMPEGLKMTVKKHQEETINIPVVAEISCGYPRFTEQEIIEYYPTDDSLVHSGGEYVWLIAKGDSMTGANIMPESMVLIRLQPDVENGEISAVCVDEEKATLKRIYKSDGQITLVSENPIYKSETYDSKRIRIVGKATFVGTKL